MLKWAPEKRALKRPRLGAPDVYPQEVRQKEDELTTVNVKHGFATMPQLTDEFGTARNCNVTASKVGAYFNSILTKKEETNTLADSGRKRQQINPKDNFWPATPRTKLAIEAWFKDLAGSKPLLSLSKKAPNYNKKEEIFAMLCEYQVPMLRAAWFVKLSHAYTAAVSEVKVKKRQLPDPTQEWTGTLIKFLKDQLTKLQEHYHAGSGSAPMSEEQKLAQRNWHYCLRLAKCLYEEALLQRHEMLQWVLDVLDKARSDDGLLRLVIPLALQYLSEFCGSELVARKLAAVCTRKLAALAGDTGSEPAAPGSEASTALATLHELTACPQHRDIVLGLSAILQAITLECPVALVWSCVGERKSALNGSPLDLLPIAPAALPMPARQSNAHIRELVGAAQESVCARSRAAESRWPCDSWHQSSAGLSTARLLTVALDALDRHNFARADATNCLDTLYAKVFAPPPPTKPGQEAKPPTVPACDVATVQVLCEWAVSGQRWGEHRAMAVAALLEKRQADLSAETDKEDDRESVSSGCGQPGGAPVFQPLLMAFLDTDAPTPDETALSRVMFANLVHLFAELIRHEVFSHDVYMCTLISRGDLNTSHRHADNKPPSPEGRSVGDEMFAGIELKTSKLEPEHALRGMDYDDSKIDDDLDKLLQHIKEEQQNSMDAPDEDDGVHGATLVAAPMSSGMDSEPSEARSRHHFYTTHFPLPQDDSCSAHDCNQRHVLLFGVGRARDEARHAVKRMTKEICKLFGKKFSIDVAEGGKVKKHSRGEFNFETVTTKMQAMSFFDQHVVTWQCVVAVLEMLSAFSAGSSSYLPVQEHVSFLLDLMELACSIRGLIDVCVQILKELPEVEAQLAAKGSSQARCYTTSLSLYVVGVLRRYHCCLLLSPVQTQSVFEGLCRAVKHVTNPGDCCSAERSVLAHLYDLYSSCSLLKGKPHAVEPFGNAYPKIRAALYSPVQPSAGSHAFSPHLMQQLIASPRRSKLEPAWARQLAESQANRYSFVCNVVVSACRETDNERLNDLAALSAELTACCNLLSAEWLGVLVALCCPGAHPAHFADVRRAVDARDPTVHAALAVFVSVLIARHCFLLEDLVVHVALPSLMKACNEAEPDSEAEAAARLTCHLLLRLFKTVECPQPALYSVGTSPQPLPPSGFSVRLSCDRHLLAAAHHNIKVGPVLAVLKAILVVGDATARGESRPTNRKPAETTASHASTNQSKPLGTGGGASELSISHILGTSDILGGGDDLALLDLGSLAGPAGSAGNSSVAGSGEGAVSLSEFAQHVLRLICSQEWVLERCLQEPEELCHPDMLLDSMLKPQQAQRLLHMICYPERSASAETPLDQRHAIARILENLDQWTLRMSWLDLQLMYKQFAAGSSELSQWLDTVAKAAIDVFQLANHGADAKEEGGAKAGSIWLVAPLVSKLPSAVQGRVLKVAGQTLEHGRWWSRGKERGCSLLGRQPFLSLVLTCLKGQDGQREGLLTSLHTQLSQFLALPKDERVSNLEEPRGRTATQDALQLRFSLVGGMLDTVQRSPAATQDWAVLLVQLVTHGVVDLDNNSQLLTTVLDVLATLIHSTLVADAASDDTRKHYQNLVKKLRKEAGERATPSTALVRQLLPLPKLPCEVIACDAIGGATDNRGHKIQGFVEKRQGLSVSERQRVNAYDLLEGLKNPAPLSWAWFGAVRVERRPLWYEETHRLLKYHTHSLKRPTAHYLDPPPLPPEELEPPPDKPMKDDGKADTPNSSDQSPRGAKRPKAQRRRRTTKAAANAAPNATPMQQPQQPPGQHLGYGGQPPQGMFPGGQQAQQAQQPQWGYQGQPPPGQQQPQQQQGYYPQQITPGVGGQRFERPLNQSKQALSQMLRMRLPGNQFVAQPAQPAQPGFPQGMRQQFMRQQLRGQHAGPVQMFPQQSQQQPQQPQQQQGPAPMYPAMQQGMNQSYAGYGGQQMQPQPPQQMMGGFPAQGQGQGPGPGQGFGPQGPMVSQRQAEYRAMGQPRQQYLQAPNVTMSTMGPLGQQQQPPPFGRGQMPAGVATPQGHPGQQQQFQQQVNQQRLRQQMLQLQQQQQQQQQQVGGNQQQPTPALVAHLQRQLSNQQPQQQQQQQQQQHNLYQQQPPPY